MKAAHPVKRTLLGIAAVVTAMLFVTSCKTTVNTLSYYNTQVGTDLKRTLDATAVTTIGNAPLAANTTGCFADGGAQTFTPYPWGTNNGAGSPKAGQCDFSSFSGANKTWYFDFFSGECAVTGQNFD